MSLRERIGNIVHGRKDKTRQLTVSIVPNKEKIEEIYKYWVIKPSNISKYFDLFADEIRQVIVDTYGKSFKTSKIENEHQLAYFFDDDGIEIEYSLFGVLNYESADDVYNSDISGILEIKVKNSDIDFKQAGKIINRFLETHILSYEEGKFKVSYNKSGQFKPLTEGIKLLDRLCVNPTEVIEYVQGMYCTKTHTHKGYENGKIFELGNKK